MQELLVIIATLFAMGFLGFRAMKRIQKKKSCDSCAYGKSLTADH